MKVLIAGVGRLGRQAAHLLSANTQRLYQARRAAGRVLYERAARRSPAKDARWLYGSILSRATLIPGTHFTRTARAQATPANRPCWNAPARSPPT